MGVDHHWKAHTVQCRLSAGTFPLRSQCIPELPQFLSISDYPPLPRIDKENIENANIYFCFFFSYPCLPLSW